MKKNDRPAKKSKIPAATFVKLCKFMRQRLHVMKYLKFQYNKIKVIINLYNCLNSKRIMLQERVH